MSKKIVIVEDNDLIIEAIKLEIKKQKYKILTAGNGEAGLQTIKKEKPNLILLDILLPKADGFNLLSVIKEDEKLKQIPVIILTNLGSKKDLLRGLELGAEDYLIKAATELAQLSKIIKQTLKSA